MTSQDLRVINAEPPGEDVIAKLEEALERAREGRISSVAIATVERDGSVGHAWSKAPSLSLLIGSITRLLWTLTKWAEG
jgi:hypothetical protein